MVRYKYTLCKLYIQYAANNNYVVHVRMHILEIARKTDAHGNVKVVAYISTFSVSF